ncbi:MAG: tRNA (adenosine(37)-N6)-threonylcarbamoyltransferase complex transferase subunit TsaD [Clostridia bacterium]|nr:tRNA (adenosine(37)-N6)-threonylcarbamoyltransferase complex transferase subunit TsaD [Clostridia bacterium]
MIIFSVESSCDETSCAVLSAEERPGATEYKILSNVVASQIETHRLFGGVVPEIASRAHADVISQVADEAVKTAGIVPGDIDAVAVTNCPGLIGCLLVGTSFAKGLASSLGVPLIPVDHIEAHAAAAYLENPGLTPSYGALVVSGGHTSLYDVTDFTVLEVAGETRDDAAGEAFDKVGRIIGLTYPAGREMDELATRAADAGVTGEEFPLPSPAIADGSFDFSFSGLKTAALNHISNLRQRMRLGKDDPLPEEVVLGMAASFTRAVCQGICKKLAAFLDERKYDTLVMAGGVAANSHLRRAAAEICEKRGVRFITPSIPLCGDNGAMVAAAGYHRFRAGITADSRMNAYASDEAARLALTRGN